MKTDNCSMYFVMYNETTFLFSKQKLVFIFYTCLLILTVHSKKYIFRVFMLKSCENYYKMILYRTSSYNFGSLKHHNIR